MKILIEMRERDFNISLASKEGAEPFLSIKRCRIVDGSKGRFVSYPAKKLESGKYWNHVYASDAFNAAVIEAYDAAAPKPAKRAATADDEVPF